MTFALTPDPVVTFRLDLKRRLDRALTFAAGAEPVEGEKYITALFAELVDLLLHLHEATCPADKEKERNEEDDRLRRIQVRSAGLEELLIQLDVRAQRYAHLLAIPQQTHVLTRIQLNLFLQAVADLVDRAPDEALALDLQSDRYGQRDPRVYSQVRAFRQLRATPA